MKKDPDQNSTDSAEIEAHIIRIERGQLRDDEAQLLARLLRLLLRLITLLQQKNASLSRLKRSGQPLVGATQYEQEVLRCSACQECFTAPLPADVKPEKYDETCDVSLALA